MIFRSIILLLIFPINLIVAQDNNSFWIQLEGPEAGWANSITAVNDDSLYAVLNYLYISDDNGETWNKTDRKWSIYSFITTNGDYYLVSSDTNKRTHYINKSTDKGITWKRFPYIDTLMYIQKIIVHDEKFVFALGDKHTTSDEEKILGLNDYKNIYYTYNEGKTWLPYFDSLYYLEGVLYDFTVNENGEVALSFRPDARKYDDPDYFIKFDQKRNIILKEPMDYAPTSLKYFGNGKYIGSSGSIYISEDGGKNWERKRINENVRFIYDFIYKDNEFYLSTNDMFYYSSDNGDTWEKRSDDFDYDEENPYEKIAESYILTMDSLAYLYLAPKRGGIYRSTNKGISWEKKMNGIHSVDCLEIVSDEKGDVYEASYSGLFKSTDHGLSWRYLGYLGINSSTIALKKPGMVFVGTYGQGILRSLDYGNTWEYVGTKTTIFDIEISKNGNIFASSGSMIWQSSDNGNTWIKHKVRINDFTIVDRDIGINNEGHIFTGSMCLDVARSTDNGTSWELVYESDFSPLDIVRNIVFNPYSEIGFVLGDDNDLKTTDNGRTWEEYRDYQFGYYSKTHTGCTIDSLGNFYIHLYSSNRNLQKILKLDPNGNTIDTLEIYYPRDIQTLAISPDGYLYVCVSWGLFRSRERIFDSTIGVQEKNANVTSLSNPIPNPTTSETNISFDLPESCRIQIRICDVLGNTISIIKKYYSQGRHTEIFNFDSYPSGIYFISLYGNGEVVTEKVEVVK
jgi:photosystem II stability/assembly factor-like uncharacterized protein